MGRKKNVLIAGNFMIPVSSISTNSATNASSSVPNPDPNPVPNSIPVPNSVPNSVPSSPPQIPVQPGFMPNPALQMGGMDPLSQTILTLNANPYLIGMFMLVLNLGGRFLTLELTKKQEAFLQQAWLRPIVFFTVIFVATRNLAAAFWVSLLFFFIIWIVANENSPFCMIPSWCGHNINNEKEKYEQNIKKLIP